MVKVKLHIRQAISLSQCRIERQTTICTHTYSYSQFRIPNSAHEHVFRLWQSRRTWRESTSTQEEHADFTERGLKLATVLLWGNQCFAHFANMSWVHFFKTQFAVTVCSCPTAAVRTSRKKMVWADKTWRPSKQSPQNRANLCTGWLPSFWLCIYILCMCATVDKSMFPWLNLEPRHDGSITLLGKTLQMVTSISFLCFWPWHV